MAVDPAATARWIVRRHERRRKALRRRLQSAQEDAARIISAIAAQYRPLRIYQWGSLVHTERFSEISDIDIAVEATSSGGSARWHGKMTTGPDRAIDFLLATLDEAHPAVLSDLGAFGAFLRQVRDRTGPG